MLGIVGILITMVFVFGGYMAAGGQMAIIFHALPFEMSMIGGSAVGAFLLANDGHTIKHTLHDLKVVFKGASRKKEDYKELLMFMYELLKTARVSPIMIESHIDKPQESALFQKYPKLLKDDLALSMICDYMRVIGMSVDDPHQMDDMIEKELEKRLEESLHSSHALQTMADGLPALGIVAAVLGVIKTMASIDQPPEVLGKMIGGALVGTFLGVFLSYGLVAPMASRLKGVYETDHQYYVLIKNILVAYLHKHQPVTCAEIARKNVPASCRPGFLEMEEALRGVKDKAA